MKKMFHKKEWKKDANIKRVKGMSLARKLIVAVVAIIVIQVLSLGITSYINSVNALESELKTSGKQMVGEVESYIDEYFSKYEDSLILTSQDPNLLNLDAKENESSEEAIKTFERYLNTYDDVLSIYFANPNNDFYAYPVVDMGDDYDATGRPWYMDAENKGESVWSEPYIDEDTGKMVVTLSTPVYDGDKLVGILAIDITLGSMSDVITEIEFGDYGEIVLVDSDNNIMTHSDESLIGEPMPVEEIMEAISSKEEGIVHYTMEEGGKTEDKFTNFTTIKGLGWKVLGITYMKEISESINGIIYSILIIGVIVLVLGIIGTIILSRKFINPLNQLVEDMKKVENGDFTVKS
ncbi:Cache 3/Cache 2 fusion domain-containing protein, partial [Clostridium sp. D2Q-14]|uniref:HAMP domain-containing protein n=1 Tax=Anaeromonas gelatinilytica TaxID=2683194 RepID=UPI00193B3FE3